MGAKDVTLAACRETIFVRLARNSESKLSEIGSDETMARYSFATTQGIKTWTGPNIELCWLDPWDPSFYYIAANRVQLTTNYAIGSSCSQDFLAWIWPSPMHIGPPVYMWRTSCETLAEYAVQQTVITNSKRSKWCGEKNGRAHHVDLPGHVCYTTPWPKFYS